jgi:protein-L-isoaspartate(D-aspartate) O-methyltransferase
MGVMENHDRFAAERRRMVQTQIAARGVIDERVLKAMRSIPRHAFVPQEYQDESYQDHPLPIGHGQTISQPYMVGLMTALLELRGDEKILEIGTGSGYQAAVLGALAAEVYSMERIPELSLRAGEILTGLGFDNVTLHVGDGSLGWPGAAPYDGMLVTAGAPALPSALAAQLKEGGHLVIPVGERLRQILQVWTKFEGKLVKEEILPVVFVPLKGAQGWQDSDK